MQIKLAHVTARDLRREADGLEKQAIQINTLAVQLRRAADAIDSTNGAPVARKQRKQRDVPVEKETANEVKPAKPKPRPKSARAEQNGKRNMPVSKLQNRVLAWMAKNKPATPRELCEALDTKSINSGLLGHADEAKRNPNSLISRGLVNFTSRDDGKNVLTYELTDAGREHVESIG